MLTLTRVGDLPETTTVSSTDSFFASWLYRVRNSAQLTARESVASRGYGSAQAFLISCTRSWNFVGDAAVLSRWTDCVVS